MFVPRLQNSEENHNIKIANNPFETVAKFNPLKLTLALRNNILRFYSVSQRKHCSSSLLRPTYLLTPWHSSPCRALASHTIFCPNFPLGFISPSLHFHQSKILLNFVQPSLPGSISFFFHQGVLQMLL
jgi:hypothetical protein